MKDHIKNTKPKRIVAKPLSDKGYYVDKEQLFTEVCAYVDAVNINKSKNLPKPQMTEWLGEAILKIATRYSYIGKFANYSYRDEMVSDAIENCINYLSNFNSEKSKNPFAYITQICFHAFIRRILKEKKQQQIKYGLLEQMGIPGLYDLFANASDIPDDAPEKVLVKEIGLSKHDIEKMKAAKEEKESKNAKPL